MPHRGLDDSSVFEQLGGAAQRMLLQTYLGTVLPTQPVNRTTPPKATRNSQIRHWHRHGKSLGELARMFGISEQRVWQITQGRRK